MHWIEGVIMIGAGCIPWLIATERFPADQLKRDEMLIRAPWLGNKKLLWGMSVFLWLLGIAAVAGLI
jgi:hypothetical protein